MMYTHTHTQCAYNAFSVICHYIWVNIHLRVSVFVRITVSLINQSFPLKNHRYFEMSPAPSCEQLMNSKWGGGTCSYLIRMMTEGVWAIAPIMLHTHITHRKVRKACWQPGLGHFPGKATASSLLLGIHAQLVRFWQTKRNEVIM